MNSGSTVFKPQDIKDFILKPSHNCKPEELKAGVNQVLEMLKKNPQVILNIIVNDEDIPAIYLLDDLCDKMKTQNQLDKLEILADNYLKELASACVFDRKIDEIRLINAFPTRKDIVAAHLLGVSYGKSSAPGNNRGV